MATRTLHLEWSDVAGPNQETGYRVEWGATPDAPASFAWAAVLPANTLQYEPQVETGRNYYWRVGALYGALAPEWSAVSGPIYVPPFPQLDTAIAATLASVSVAVTGRLDNALSATIAVALGGELVQCAGVRGSNATVGVALAPAGFGATVDIAGSGISVTLSGIAVTANAQRGALAGAYVTLTSVGVSFSGATVSTQAVRAISSSSRRYYMSSGRVYSSSRRYYTLSGK